MLRRNFQILVASSQVLAIAIVFVQYVTESSLPPELLGYLHNYETILIPDRFALLELLTNVPFLIQTSLGILAAVGLIRFRAWGRSVFLVYIVTELALSALTGPHVNTGWTVLVGYICGLAEGVILALMYLTPIKEMFEKQGEIQQFICTLQPNSVALKKRHCDGCRMLLVGGRSIRAINCAGI